jgi:hypothetical protein
MAVALLPQAAPTTRQPKGWIATLVVGVLMTGILVVGFVGADAIPAQPPRAVAINRAATIMPADGWDFAGRSDDGGTILLTNGSGSLAVDASIQFAIELCRGCDPLNRKRSEWLETGTVVVSPIRDVVIGNRAAQRFDYSGTFSDVPTPVEGTVTYMRGDTAYAVFDGWAGLGDYSVVSDDVDQMISTAIIH